MKGDVQESYALTEVHQNGVDPKKEPPGSPDKEIERPVLRTEDTGCFDSLFRDPYTPKGFISASSKFQGGSISPQCELSCPLAEKWDLLLMLLLLYVMTVTPFEVCFLSSQGVRVVSAVRDGHVH